ncbi:MAG: signal peptidase I [Lachnospiraceae bacterium]|nr:signal peptidase I [Lachnospiraceae bacterium]
MEENKKEMPVDKAKYVLKETVSWAVIIVAAVAIALFLTNYVIFKAVVPTGSMNDTIMEEDKLIGNRLFKNVDRGDIVIFPQPDWQPSYGVPRDYYVKRVIGLPGETVEVKDGAVYINGTILKEDYLKEEMLNFGAGTYEVPDGCYFCMGDNRNHSGDARFWTNKYITKDDITAKVMFRYSPSVKWFKKPIYE